MTAFGGAVIAGQGGGSLSQLDTASLNVTGSDLCLVMAGSGETSLAPTLTLTFDPTGTPQSATAEFQSLDDVGGYVYSLMEYIDDPTAANSFVRLGVSADCDALGVGGVFFTAAANCVATDSNSAGYTTGTTMTTTVGNVASGDMVVDFIHYDPQGDPGTAATVGADQTNRGDSGAAGTYSRFAISTQAGADGGVMSWTVPTVRAGATIMAARIPDAGGADVTGTGTPAAQAATASGVGERTVDGTGTPAAQAAAVAGVGERIVTGTGAPAAQVSAASGAGTIISTVQVQLTAANNRELKDAGGVLVANLNNIVWEWYDDPTSTAGNPTDSGTFNTNASGEATFNVDNSTLANGEFGQLILYHPTLTDVRASLRVPVVA